MNENYCRLQDAAFIAWGFGRESVIKTPHGDFHIFDDCYPFDQFGTNPENWA